MLLVFCLPSFFLFGVIQLGAAAMSINDDDGFYSISMTIAKIILYIVQVMIQTPMIIDGLRRCSNSADSQERKAGRNTLMFLIVANLSVYIMDTFLLKTNIYKAGRNTLMFLIVANLS